MNLYENHILPHLINFTCTSPPIQRVRKRVVPQCTGKVLEVGMGSAVNLEFYDTDNIEFVWGLEPSEGMRRKAQKNIRKSNIKVKWLDLPSEKIPLEDECVDTVLLTFTLCTIPDFEQALKQMRRVLKPEGKLLFSEHGLAPDTNIEKWQNRLNKPWGCISGGCNLNRPIDQIIQESGFVIESLECFYAPQTPKFAGYIYLGAAKKAT